MPKDLNTLISKMDKLFEMHCTCRSHFPYMNRDLIGVRVFPTAPYYGVKLVFQSVAGLTAGDIDRVNGIGHYINQNFVIRLYALLESYHVISGTIQIDTELVGNEDLDILRRLRNSFGHASGNYNSSDKEGKRLRDRVISHYKLSDREHNGYPLPIDTVLDPMLNACKDYVRGFYKKQKS